jgi:hypothetical protein
MTGFMFIWDRLLLTVDVLFMYDTGSVTMYSAIPEIRFLDFAMSVLKAD